jgi:DNA repair exonuclease SbcCD ATPase subunit
VLPIINSELDRLMDEVCDFEIELVINSKNEVEYLLTKDDIEKSLKSGSGFERTISSLALRCVLGKMSHLPMPNFITFDEVLGKVSSENLHKMQPMFEKIKGMFDIVFLITHNDTVKDWGDNIITIKKTNNISKIHAK